MRTRATQAVMTTLALSALVSSAYAGDLHTVTYVDVSKYLGTWYQIARNPIFFEGNCTCSRQILGALPNGIVSVDNTCNENTPQGPLQTITGTATNEDPATNSKFLVDFNLPNKGQYWIIDVADDYRYAVVTDPSEKSLYILSKTPTLSAADYQAAVSAAAQQVDTSQLIVTVQQGCTYPSSL